MIEAMACGTPVIAFRSGSTPEVVDDGVTGFLVDDVEAAAAAVARVTKLNRAKVRARFDERFAIERVAEDYLNIYRALPGVRRVARRIAAPHQPELARLGALSTASRLRFQDCRGLGRRRLRQPSEAQFIVTTSIAAERSSTLKLCKTRHVADAGYATPITRPSISCFCVTGMSRSTTMQTRWSRTIAGSAS